MDWLGRLWELEELLDGEGMLGELELDDEELGIGILALDWD